MPKNQRWINRGFTKRFSLLDVLFPRARAEILRLLFTTPHRER